MNQTQSALACHSAMSTAHTVGIMLAICTFASTAVATESTQLSQVGTFFQGCTVIPGTPSLPYLQIRGKCLDHTFSSEEKARSATMCRVTLYSRNKKAMVHECKFDGRLAEIIYFDAVTGKVQVKWMSSLQQVALLGNVPRSEPTINLDDPAQFFQGCTVIQNPDGLHRIHGTCLEHMFSNNGLNSDIEKCQVSPYNKEPGNFNEFPNWTIFNCTIDGKLITQASINKKTRKLVDLQVMDSLAIKQEEERQSRYAQQLPSPGAEGRQTRLCPEPAATQAESTNKGATIYGLVLSAPLPCLNDCSVEPEGTKTPMCRDSASNLTPWGTKQFRVNLNSNVFDFFTQLRTGAPTLELLEGKLVGVRFDNISQEVEHTMVTQLSSKFGKYQHGGGVYVWTTPMASVRYAVDDHLSGGAILGGFLTGEFGDSSGTITIYTPSVRTLVDKYEAEQAKKNKKQGF